jgi:hypothetical protein
MMALFERLRQADDPLSLALIDASFPLAELLELCAMGQGGTPQGVYARLRGLCPRTMSPVARLFIACARDIVKSLARRG